MRKRMFLTIIVLIAMANSCLALYWTLSLNRSSKQLEQERSHIQSLHESLYTEDSLEMVMLKMEEELDREKAIRKREENSSPLRMAEEVLRLMEKDSIHILDYRFEEDGNETILVLSAEGEMANILRLFYKLSIQTKQLQIISFTIDAKRPEKPATLYLRIGYA